MNTPARTLQVMALAFMSAIVTIGVVLAFVLPTEAEAAMPWTPIGALLLGGLVWFFVVEAVGYRVPPLPTGLSPADAAAQSRIAWQGRAVMRLALAELPAFVGVALAFALPDDNAWWIYVAGAAVALVLLGVHGWPSQRAVLRTADHLESGGQKSYLPETLAGEI